MFDPEEVELRARKISAEIMCRVKDPEGLLLPDELWTQKIDAAIDSLTEDAAAQAEFERELINDGFDEWCSGLDVYGDNDE